MVILISSVISSPPEPSTDLSCANTWRSRSKRSRSSVERARASGTFRSTIALHPSGIGSVRKGTLARHRMSGSTARTSRSAPMSTAATARMTTRPVRASPTEHLQRHLHPPERRAHLDPLHRALHLLEHLARDRDALGERRLFSLLLRLPHPGEHRLRHRHPGHLVREKL